MFSAAPILPFLAAEADIGEVVGYQLLGIIVVFFCLSFLAAVLSCSGKIAQMLSSPAASPKKAASAAETAALPAPADSASEDTPAPQVAALAASIYASAQESLTPELIAVIAAAVYAECGSSHRIVAIAPVSGNYARSGRAEIFASRRR